MTEISELIAENVPIILIQLFDLILLLYTFTSTSHRAGEDQH